MRNVTLVVAGLLLPPFVGTGCADAVPDEGVILNRGALGAAPGSPHDAIGARHIVKFKDKARGAAALQAAGARVVLDLGPQNAAAAHIPPQALDALSKNPNIEYIEEDPVRMPLGGGTQVQPYGIDLVQANDVPMGSGVGVCIIDSGYHAGHEDLSANGVRGFQSGWNTDDCGHGTHVAGTIRALDNTVGVVGAYPSEGLELFIVKVFSGAACDWTYASTLVDALNKCTGTGALVGPKKVISMSLGGGAKSKTEENAFNAAEANGVLSIAAAGNDGNTRMSYPASYSSVVSVAAIDKDKNLADFSQRNAQVELAAPGVAVGSTVPWTNPTISVGGDTYRGTTMELSNAVTVSGELADGGLCLAASPGAFTGTIVLCQRGDISFEDKVKNAAASGAIGVVIYNNVSGGFSGTLGTTSALPAIAISLEDGLALLGALPGTGTLVNVIVAGSGYEDWDGTSMATPHVSAVAARVWSNHITKTNKQVRQALGASALDLGAIGRDSSFGFGLVQAAAAHALLGGGGGGCTPTQSTESSCNDGVDNDCDGAADATDTDCQAGQCTLLPLGARCTSNAQCCSNACKGPPNNKTCK
ncbi:MAG: S8 family serine peptidase [Deltaproteobacteria bacterium]|nr:S8 family serine peptidase [Deltaproteobacteria bacterium]